MRARLIDAAPKRISRSSFFRRLRRVLRSVYLRPMKQSFFVYPGGFSGIALLLLRFSVALSLSSTAPGPLGDHLWSALATGLFILGLSFGFCTRISAFVAASIFLAQLGLGAGGAPTNLIADALAAAGLAMAGPGAFSFDALRFGRRTLHLPD